MRASRHLAKRIWQRPSADAATSSTSPGIPGRIAASFQRDCRRSLSSQSSSDGTQVVVDQYESNSKQPSTNEDAATTKILNNPEHADATALVDNLLAYTRELMDQHKQLEENRTNIRHIVAFSGGIDSSLVLALLTNAAAAAAAPSHNTTLTTESVHAVMGRSPAVPQDQVALARRVANHIGIPLEEVKTTEGNDQVYIENNGQACLACKTHLYEALQAVAEHAASEDALLRGDASVVSTQQQQRLRHHHHHILYNGTNADDRKDATRVGLIAAQNFHVQSPLKHTTKDDVRRAARHLGLPNWNVAASPCLRSRLALGVAATQEHLERIEAAERFVRNELLVSSQKKQHNGGATAALYSETTNLRVRLLAGNRACLEIDADLLPQVQSQLQQASTTSWDSYFVQTLGFEAVHARAFRSGSVSVKTTKDSQSPTGRLREATVA